MSNPNHDEELYAQAAAELEDGNRDEGLWAKCFAECDGEEDKAKARYVKTRAERLPKNPITELLKLIAKWFKLLLYAIAWLSGLFFILFFLFVSMQVVFDITNEILIFIFGETIADKLSHDLYAPDKRIPDVSRWVWLPLQLFIGIAMLIVVNLAFAFYVLPQMLRLDDWLKKRLKPGGAPMHSNPNHEEELCAQATADLEGGKEEGKPQSSEHSLIPLPQKKPELPLRGFEQPGLEYSPSQFLGVPDAGEKHACRILEVIAAIICKKETYLIARRATGNHLAGLWEFPGGKLEKGEGHTGCLTREILEELNLKINVSGYFHTTEHDYDGKVVRLHAYFAEIKGGDMELDSHDKVAWVTLAEFDNYEFAPADIPIIQKLREIY